MASFTPRSAALLNYPRPEWVSPTAGSTIPATEPLVFKSVARSSGTAHFNVQVDSQSDFSTATNYRSDRGGFEYWNGTAWTAIPTAGMPFASNGNNIRLTTDLPPGSQYIRVRQSKPSFPYYRLVTLNTTSTGAGTSSSISSFPVCVTVNNLSWSDPTVRGHFFDASNVSGKRVQFFDPAGRSLSYEVESYDGANQSAVYWVNLPTIAANSTTTVIVGYGADINRSDQDSATAAWNSNFKGVWHLGNNQWLASAPEGTDSTGQNNLTNFSTTDVAGISGQGRAFTGSTSVTIKNAAPSGFDVDTYTLSFWMYPTGTGAIIYRGTPGVPGQIALHYASSKLSLDIPWVLGAVAVSTNTLPTSAWTHAVVTRNGSSYAIYTNGTANGTATNSAAATYSGPLGLGSMGAGGSVAMAGRIDEARISNVARSIDWAKAEYFSLKTTSWPGDGWMTWGGETTQRPF